MENQIWINGGDIMTIAKLFNLSYADAKDKIVELVTEDKEVIFND